MSNLDFSLVLVLNVFWLRGSVKFEASLKFGARVIFVRKDALRSSVRCGGVSFSMSIRF